MCAQIEEGNMLPERIVIDTNVILSYAISKKMVELTEVKSKFNIEIFSCEELLHELRLAIEYPQVEKYFHKLERQRVISLFKSLATEIEIDLRYDRLNDPKDNYLIDLAYASKSNYLVTGDREVLLQKHVGKIQIISPAQFKKILNN